MRYFIDETEVTFDELRRQMDEFLNRDCGEMLILDGIENNTMYFVAVCVPYC